jgi:hypothetical protein
VGRRAEKCCQSLSATLSARKRRSVVGVRKASITGPPLPPQRIAVQCTIGGAGVPSDHLPTQTMRIVTRSSGSSAAITGEPGRSAPQLFAASARHKKHQMGMPVQAACRLSTAASRACSTSLQAPARAVPSYPVRMRSPDDLRLRFSCQHQFGFHQEDGHKGPCGWRIEANRAAHFGIPEIRIIGRGAP